MFKGLVGRLRAGRNREPARRVVRQRVRGSSGELEVFDDQKLVGTYEDETVQEQALEDARTAAFTGEFNREHRFLNAMLASCRVACDLIGHRLHEQLKVLGLRLEKLREAIRVTKAQLHPLAATMASATERQEELSEQIHNEGLSQPEQGKKARRLEIGLLVPLGLGDVLFISLAYQILGLSDHRLFSFLPLTELQLAASTSVAALLYCARIAGHRLRSFTHQLGLVAGGTRKVDLASSRLQVAGAAKDGFETLLALAGGAAILLGVSGIRTAFLEAQGVPAHAGAFLAVQTGIALAGVLLAAWFAHPYDKIWSDCQAAVAKARLEFELARDELLDKVGEFNSLIELRQHTTSQHLIWDSAVRDNTARQVELYAMWLLRAQLEPAEQQLLPAELPRPEMAEWVSEVSQELREQSDACLTRSLEKFDLQELVELIASLEGGGAEARREPANGVKAPVASRLVARATPSQPEEAGLGEDIEEDRFSSPPSRASGYQGSRNSHPAGVEPADDKAGSVEGGGEDGGSSPSPTEAESGGGGESAGANRGEVHLSADFLLPTNETRSNNNVRP